MGLPLTTTKAERAKLIRARFKKLFPIAAQPPLKPTGKRREPPPPCGKAPMRDDNFGPNTYGRAEPKAVWIFRAEKTQSEKLPTRRTKHDSPLTKIARKWASPSWREETKRLDLYHA